MATSIVDKRRVAIAYDCSEDAQKLFQWSLKNIVRADTDHVILLSAMQIGDKTAGSSFMPTSPGKVKSPLDLPADSTTRGRLEALGEELRKMGISSEAHVLTGDAKALIPRYTQNNQVELLIVGSRGLGTVKSVFLGSVSDRCIHECPCPVLVVRNATI